MAMSGKKSKNLNILEGECSVQSAKGDDLNILLTVCSDFSTFSDLNYYTENCTFVAQWTEVYCIDKFTEVESEHCFQLFARKHETLSQFCYDDGTRHIRRTNIITTLGHSTPMIPFSVQHVEIIDKTPSLQPSVGLMLGLRRRQ